MSDRSARNGDGGLVDPGLLKRLSAAAAALDATTAWPQAQLNWLAEAGVLRSNIPCEYGGEERSAADMTAMYESLSTACLTTTFILTQRNAAVQRIVDSENTSLKQRLLPDLACGAIFATVGISHLTTSRQHLVQPAVRIEPEGGSLRLTGTVPWVTGAPAADYIVTGGTLSDGRQMLVALPRELDGIEIRPPTRLLALNASQTCAVLLNNVRVPADCTVAGPVEGVINRSPSGGTGSVTTSALAVGLAARSVRDLEIEAERRADLHEIVPPLRAELESVRADMYAVVNGQAPFGSPAALRQRANSLVLRVTQAQLAASKGAGYVSGHPAELAVREALFFLVWSCPQPVVAAALREFACVSD